MHSAQRFAGKNVLVVGGGADGPASRRGESVPIGNGRAIAMRIAAEGGRVAVTDLALERAQATVDALGTEGLAIEADAADQASCRQAVRTAEAELGELSAVVCNVGVTGTQPGRVQSVEDWQWQMDVNVRSHWLTAQEALQPMIDRGGGSLVFVSSLAAIRSTGRSLAYEASKAALLAVARHFGVRYASRGIRANALVIGVIDSTMVRRLWGDADDVSARRDAMVPMRRQGRPEEAAAAAAFLASDDSSFITGIALVVDGGQSASDAAVFGGA
jgi:NAD(P)-dependent dehydrogenase (short-subunit alcohol dehydrogenase family)